MRLWEIGCGFCSLFVDIALRLLLLSLYEVYKLYRIAGNFRGKAVCKDFAI